MINPVAITSCLSGLVGFRPAIDKNLPKVSAALQASESGIMVNDMHSLVTVEHINACIENAGSIEYPDVYAAGTTYAIGDKVHVVIGNEKTVFESLQAANVGHTPASSPTYWVNQGTVMNQYLTNKLSQGAVKLANAIYNQKNLAGNSKSVLGDIMLYTGSGNINNTITKRGRFVGFKLYIKGQDLTVALSKIGMQFNEIQTAFTLYIYHNSQLEPIKEIELTTTKAFSFEWKIITKELLTFLGDDLNAGGHFTIGYYEDDLQGEAIERKTNLTSVSSCSSCDPANSSAFRKWNKYVGLQPFYVESDFLNENKDYWDEDKEIIVENQNWGLNLQLSVFCDVTPYLCRNKGAIAQAYALQVAVSIIEDMGFSSRDNQKMLKLQQMANYALNIKENYAPGLYKELEKAIKTLSFNFSGVNPECLPCQSSGYNIKIKSAF